MATVFEILAFHHFEVYGGVVLPISAKEARELGMATLGSTFQQYFFFPSFYQSIGTPNLSRWECLKFNLVLLSIMAAWTC